MEGRMKHLAIVIFAVVLGLGASTAAYAEEGTTLNGSFVWEHGNTTGDLEAVFTPTGEATWDVSFHFTFRNQPHTYSGTASGSLSEGTLSGTVMNETKKRTFTFGGTFDDGVFSGEHAEVGESGSMQTGTLTLR
jgi:hypothetical protein